MKTGWFHKDNSVTFVLLEGGTNHNGNVNQALRLIDIAKEAAADAIKFQCFNAETNLSNKIKHFPFLKGNPIEELKKFELSYLELKQLRKHAKEKEIAFTLSFSHQSDFEKIRELDLDFYKISSFFIDAPTILEKVAEDGKPTILSTGTADLSEIEKAVDIFIKKGNDNLALLHCVSCYPTKDEYANLLVIKTLQEKFSPLTIGYSDHTKGILASTIAVALGAKIIEKHFTFSRKLYGPDHSFAIEPSEVMTMIENIRKTERLLGSSDKVISDEEEQMKRIARRSIFASCFIKRGTVISENMLTLMRPGTGIKPFEIRSIINKKASNDLGRGKMLEWSDFE
tara:strand:- start:438 stop:1460 length:1023 start_codon:yes stop_codon:yes gene_type:complete